MSFSTSTLFYGITVTVTSLCFTAAAYADVKSAVRAVDLIRSRRDQGRLETSSSTGARDVRDVPSEVWELVKTFLSDEARADRVDAFVRQHIDPNCTCGWCQDRAAAYRHVVHQGLPSDRPRRFTLDDLDECLVYKEEPVHSSALLEESRAAIDIFLADYGLYNPHTEPIATARNDSCAIALPLAPRPTTSTPHVRVDHDLGNREWPTSSSVLEISPSIFALPADAPVRFHRLLKTFPTLKPTTTRCGSIYSASDHSNSTTPSSTSGVHYSIEGLIRAQKRARAREKAAREPKWLLLGQITT
ncbi:hypothetical protein JCM3775_004645 [Rhodotorula graminis]